MWKDWPRIGRRTFVSRVAYLFLLPADFFFRGEQPPAGKFLEPIFANAKGHLPSSNEVPAIVTTEKALDNAAQLGADTGLHQLGFNFAANRYRSLDRDFVRKGGTSFPGEVKFLSWHLHMKSGSVERWRRLPALWIPKLKIILDAPVVIPGHERCRALR